MRRRRSVSWSDRKARRALCLRACCSISAGPTAKARWATLRGLLTLGNSEKEREHADLESDASVANRNLQIAEANLSSLKSQLKAKQDEAKGNQTPTISV